MPFLVIRNRAFHESNTKWYRHNTSLGVHSVNDCYSVLHSSTNRWGENWAPGECIRTSGWKQEMSKLNVGTPMFSPSKTDTRQTPSDKWISWILSCIEYSCTTEKKSSFRVLSFAPAHHTCCDSPLLRCHLHVTNKQLPPEHPFLVQCCFSSRNHTTVCDQMASLHCQEESEDDEGWDAYR